MEEGDNTGQSAATFLPVQVAINQEKYVNRSLGPSLQLDGLLPAFPTLCFMLNTLLFRNAPKSQLHLPTPFTHLFTRFPKHPHRNL